MQKINRNYSQGKIIMENKKDWEELEKWNREKEQEEQEKYGANIEKFNEDNKNAKKFIKIFNRIIITIYIIGKTAVILAILAALVLVILYFWGIHLEYGM